MLHKFSVLAFHRFRLGGGEKKHSSKTVTSVSDGKTFNTLNSKMQKNSGEVLQALCFPLSSSFVIGCFNSPPNLSIHCSSSPSLFNNNYDLKYQPPFSSICGVFFLFSLVKLSAPPPVLHPFPTSQFTPLFTFCSCQSEWPAGRWHSGTWQAAPPSSWQG